MSETSHKELSVVCEVTRFDIILVTFLLGWRSKSNFFILVFVWALVFFVTFPSSGDRTIFSLSVAALSSLIIILVPSLVIQIIAILALLGSQQKKNGILGEHIFKISEAGLYEKTPVNEGIQHWKAFQSVILTKRYLCFSLNTYLCYVLPLRAFKNKEEAESFCDTALEYFRNNKEG